MARNCTAASPSAARFTCDLCTFGVSVTFKSGKSETAETAIGHVEMSAGERGGEVGFRAMPGLAVPLRPQGMQSKARAGHCTTMLTTLWKWRAATQVLLQRKARKPSSAALIASDGADLLRQASLSQWCKMEYGRTVLHLTRFRVRTAFAGWRATTFRAAVTQWLFNRSSCAWMRYAFDQLSRRMLSLRSRREADSLVLNHIIRSTMLSAFHHFSRRMLRLRSRHEAHNLALNHVVGTTMRSAFHHFSRRVLRLRSRHEAHGIALNHAMRSSMRLLRASGLAFAQLTECELAVHRMALRSALVRARYGAREVAATANANMVRVLRVAAFCDERRARHRLEALLRWRKRTMASAPSPSSVLALQKRRHHRLLSATMHTWAEASKMLAACAARADRARRGLLHATLARLCRAAAAVSAASAVRRVEKIAFARYGGRSFVHLRECTAYRSHLARASSSVALRWAQYSLRCAMRCVLQDTVSRLLVNRLFKRPAKAWWSARATARAMLALNGAAKACYFQAHVRAHACVRQLRMRFARWRSVLRHESRKNAMAVHALHAWQRLAATRAVRALQRAREHRCTSAWHSRVRLQEAAARAARAAPQPLELAAQPVASEPARPLPSMLASSLEEPTRGDERVSYIGPIPQTVVSSSAAGRLEFDEADFSCAGALDAEFAVLRARAVRGTSGVDGLRMSGEAGVAGVSGPSATVASAPLDEEFEAWATDAANTPPTPVHQHPSSMGQLRPSPDASRARRALVYA